MSYLPLPITSFFLLTKLLALLAFAAAVRKAKPAIVQPTVVVLHFPFVLLPAFIVPAAILCHLAVFRKLSTAASVHTH
jgi:sorbitol-specific phosphotransferase system component IIC